MSDDKQVRADESAFRAAIHEESRPWGAFRRFPHEDAGAVKIITVLPGAALSLQKHARRSEFWVVLDAGLEMQLGEKTWQTSPNEEIFIPCGAAHRVRNTGGGPARIMEIWIGRSTEDDVVRLKDDYGRR